MKKNDHLYKSIFLYFNIIIFVLCSCNKSSFLSASPNQALVEPSTLTDYQALLDNDTYMNGNSQAGLVPDFEQAGTDDYFANSILSALGTSFENLYTWNDDIYSYPFADWDFGYRCVFYANEVLTGSSSLSVADKDLPSLNNIKGSALFYRAHAFYHLAQVFAPQYDSSTAGSDLGIPLRLTSDINEKISRASSRDSYKQIISDLQASLQLLPASPLYKTRPSKPAAYGLLAKVYLSMMDYPNARLYADSCLQLESSLFDYNTLLPISPNSYPFSRYINEVIFSAVQINDPMTNIGIARVDSSLYASYDSNDLRKTLFFSSDQQGAYTFSGSYYGTNDLFAGIATDEMFLIRAEGYARMGNTSAALGDLNTLLSKRYAAGTFSPLSISSAADALDTILLERRKELVFRGTRWMDLRRLNKEGSNISITRVLNGQDYLLTPNNLHYTYLIPSDVIGFNPTMLQNPR